MKSSTIPHFVNEIKRLRRRDYRAATGLTIVEGYPEVQQAIKAGVEIQTLYICPEIFPIQDSSFDDLNVVHISVEEFAQIAFGARLKGILAIAKPRVWVLDDLPLSENPFVVMMQGVEKPGNLGTVIRTSDGAGVDAVINCDARTDVFNHNVVRSSIGTVFHVPTADATTESAYQYFQKHKIKTIATSANAEQNYMECDLSGPCAILIGTEHDGLSSFWHEHADERVKIPMLGQGKCLNAAASATVLIYEALRQRRASLSV